MNRYVVALPVGHGLGLAVHLRFLERFDPSLESLLQFLTDSLLIDDLIACLEKAPDVAEDGQIDAPVPADLLRLDVHLDQLCVLAEQLTEDVVEADPCAQEDDQVRAHVGEHGRSRPDRKGRFETEGVCVRNGSPACGAGEGGHAGLLDELDEILCAVRVPGAAPGDHDRLLCSLDHLHQARRVLVVHGAGRDPRPHVPDLFRVREGVQDINRIFQIHRTRATAYGSSIGKVQELWDAFRFVADQGLLHHRFDDGCLVHILQVEFLDRLDSDTPRDENHGRVGEARVCDGGEGVREARTGRDHGDSRLAGHPAPRLGHEDGGLLVSRVYERYGRVFEVLVDGRDVATTQGEDVFDPLLDQRLCSQLPTLNRCHGFLLLTGSIFCLTRGSFPPRMTI